MLSQNIIKSVLSCYLLSTIVGSLSATAFMSPTVPSRQHISQVQQHPNKLPFVAPSATASTFTSTRLRVVADPPMEKEEEQIEDDEDIKNQKDWIESENGGFIPNLKSRIQKRIQKKATTTSSSSPDTKTDDNRTKPSFVAVTDKTKKQFRQKQKEQQVKPNIIRVTDIQEFKEHVADETNQMVCVRFYAPWCRACRAMSPLFNRLAREYSNQNVKFVEVPLTETNSYLHNGLGVPSLPYGHLYHPNVGLVEERKINKHMFKTFRQVLQTYVDGECVVKYEDDDKYNGPTY